MWPKASPAPGRSLLYLLDDAPGITRKRRGRNFAYYDARRRQIRNPKILSRIRSLVIPPAWESVWISPLENSHLQAVGRDAKGRKQYRYHARFRQARDLTKFDKLAEFGALLPRIRARIARDFQLPGLNKQKVVATVVRLLDDTCVRVGNEEYARANGSYGLTTLRNRHAKIRGDTIRLRFRGKSGQDLDITLCDARIARVLRRLQDLPGQDLFQYQTESGEFVSLTSSDVNEYLREVSGSDVTAKDFRTWHGSGYALSNLTALGPAASESEARHNIIEAVKSTAARLGNKPATCRKYYIHPAVLENYENGKLFDILQNAKTRAKAQRGLKPEEAALLRVIKAASKSSSRNLKAVA